MLYKSTPKVLKQIMQFYQQTSDDDDDQIKTSEDMKNNPPNKQTNFNRYQLLNLKMLQPQKQIANNQPQTLKVNLDHQKQKQQFQQKRNQSESNLRQSIQDQKQNINQRAHWIKSIPPILIDISNKLQNSSSINETICKNGLKTRRSTKS